MNFSNALISWYLKTNRDLPWRKSKNPYHVWLSEIMLQQTRVEQGIPYFFKFIEAFPTVFDLANAQEDYVLKLWQGLGYYSRARNLHFTAKYIVSAYNGVFPQTYEELIKLKGVGDYTASAIASICFDKPNAVVDGNVYRVLSRYFAIETPINSTKGIKEFKLLAQQLLDVANPGAYNQAIMDFGALHCKPKNPLCDQCFFNLSCAALAAKKVNVLPYKEKKIKIKNRFFNYLFVLTDDNQTVLRQRKNKGIWQGLFEFPLIETTNEISEKELIATKEFESLFPNQTTIRLFNSKQIIHKLSHQHLHTSFWVVHTSKVNESLYPLSTIEEFAVPVLIEKFLQTYLTKN